MIISRHAASAAAFAAIAAAGIAFAAEARAPSLVVGNTSVVAPVRPAETLVLPMVKVTGHHAR